MLFLGMISFNFKISGLLPDMIPSKFDPQQNPISYISKEMALGLMPIIYILVMLIVFLGLKFSKKPFKATGSRDSILKILLGIGILFYSIDIQIFSKVLGYPVYPYIEIGLSIFALFLGNYIGKIERNYLIGYRLPSTLNSEESWKLTHEFAGKVLTLFSLISLPVLLFIPSSNITLIIYLVIFLIVLFIPLGKSLKAN